MSRTRMTTLIFILSELSSLDGLSYNALYVEYRSEYFHETVEEVMTKCLVFKILRLLC